MEKKRLVYIDYLKITAMLGVVMSHSLVEALNKDKLSATWQISNVILGFISPAVGVFFLVSGALLLSSPHTRDLKYLFKHRLVKVGVPFLFWSAISIAILMQIDHQFSWGGWAHRMLLMYHQFPIMPYWFLYPLIGFYLLSPMMKAFVDKADNKTIDYIIVLWFVTNILLPFIAKAVPNAYADYFSYVPSSNLILLGQSFGYFLIGYRLANAEIKPKTLWVNVTSAILLILITIVLNLEDAIFNMNIKVISFDSITGLLAAIEIFLTMKKWAHRHPGTRVWRRYMATLSGLTYGVYLIHGMVIQILLEIYKVNNFFIVFLVTTVVALLVAFIISLIPKVRYYVLGIQ